MTCLASVNLKVVLLERGHCVTCSWYECNMCIVLSGKNLGRLMAQSGNVKLKKPHEEFYRNVILLKHGDFRRVNGHACLPTSIDMAKIKATAGGAQFKKGVEFSSRMPPDLVQKKLVEIFPHLENRR